MPIVKARHHIALAVLLTLSVIARTQPFQVERLSYVGGGGPDRTVAARIASDGTIVLASDSVIRVVNAQGIVTATTTITSDDDDQIYDVVIEPSGTILVAVETEADPYPVTGSVGTVEDNERPLLLRFSADLSTVIAAFHFKIDHSIDGMQLSVSADGRISVVGTTEEDVFPTTANAMHDAYAGDGDGLLCVVDQALATMLYATYLGDEHRDTLQRSLFDANGALYAVGVVGTEDDESDLLFVALDDAYTVKVNRTEPNDDDRHIMSMTATTTSLTLGVMSMSGPSIEVRSTLGVVTRTIPTSAVLDALRSVELVGNDVLVSGSHQGQSTTVRIDLVNGDTVWTHHTGGSAPDTCYASRLTPAGLVMAGSTTSNDLPTTANAYQRTTLDPPGAVLDHWFSLASATVPPKTVIRVTPTVMRFDSVIVGDSHGDSVQCILVSGPSTSITSATLLTSVPGLAITTAPPQSVSTSSSPFFVVRWTPADTGVMNTTLRFATPDTTIDIAISGWSHDTTSPPPPPPTPKPRVRLSSDDLGVITMGVAQTSYLDVRIDSVKALTFDSVTVVCDGSVQVVLPTMPRAATIPTDQIAIGITATRVGVDSAVVTLHYPDSTATGVIHWVVLQPGAAQWTTSDVDRGTIVCGVSDTAWITVRNIGSESGEIRDIALTNDANGEIVIDHASLPATIDPGAVMQIRVIATPVNPRDVRVRCLATVDDDGSDEDTISAQYRYRSVLKPVLRPDDDSVLDVVTSDVYRDTVITPPPPDTVQAIRFAIDGHSATIGESFALSLMCTEGGDWLRQHQVQSVTFTLTYRRSVLTIQTPVTDPQIFDTLRTVTVTSASLALSDTTATLLMTACLGDADSSEIIISGFDIVIDTGRIALDTQVASVVHVIDSWPSDTPRHVQRDTLMPALEIYPNPVVGESTLSLHACTPGATVMVHSVDGRFVVEWTSTMTEGVRDVHITLPGGLTPGMYMCTYRSNDTAVYRPFVVVR